MNSTVIILSFVVCPLLAAITAQQGLQGVLTIMTVAKNKRTEKILMRGFISHDDFVAEWKRAKSILAETNAGDEKRTDALSHWNKVLIRSGLKASNMGFLLQGPDDDPEWSWELYYHLIHGTGPYAANTGWF